MAENNATSNSNTGMAFIVGGLVVAVVVLGYFMFAGDAGSSDDVTVTIEGGGDAVESAGDAIEGAADAVEGAAEDATGN